MTVGDVIADAAVADDVGGFAVAGAVGVVVVLIVVLVEVADAVEMAGDGAEEIATALLVAEKTVAAVVVVVEVIDSVAAPPGCRWIVNVNPPAYL